MEAQSPHSGFDQEATPTKSHALISLALLPLLVVPQVYAASYLATSSTGGASGGFVGELFGGCDRHINGKVNFQAGGSTIAIQLPYIPVLSCLSDTSAYQIPPVSIHIPDQQCNSDGSNYPCLVYYISFCLPGVLSWACISIPWIHIEVIPIYIVDVVENWLVNNLIKGFNEIWGGMWYWFVYIANAALSVINTVILAIDVIPLGIGAVVVDFVTMIPEPYSAFLAPWAWLIVLAVMILMAMAVILGARFIYSAVKTGAEVGLEAA